MKFVFAAFALALVAAPAMAQNPTQIAAVTNGAAACVACNLFQADLSFLDLTDRNLSKARLRQADLTAVIADRGRFQSADLSMANAFGARFSGANLTGADLSDASLVGTVFDGAMLTGAMLARANLSGADLSRARGLTQKQLAHACGDESTRLPEGVSVPACN